MAKYLVLNVPNMSFTYFLASLGLMAMKQSTKARKKGEIEPPSQKSWWNWASSLSGKQLLLREIQNFWWKLIQTNSMDRNLTKIDWKAITMDRYIELKRKKVVFADRRGKNNKKPLQDRVIHKKVAVTGGAIKHTARRKSVVLRLE